MIENNQSITPSENSPHKPMSNFKLALQREIKAQYNTQKAFAEAMSMYPNQLSMILRTDYGEATLLVDVLDKLGFELSMKRKRKAKKVDR